MKSRSSIRRIRLLLIFFISVCCLLTFHLETTVSTTFAFQLSTILIPPAEIRAATTAVRASRIPRRTRRHGRPRRHSIIIHVKKVVQNTDIVTAATTTAGEKKESTAVIIQHEESSSDDKQHQLLGLVVLLTVPIVWGSYVPVVKVLYQIDPPIPGLVFSTAYFAVASISSFILLNILKPEEDKTTSTSSSSGNSQQSIHEEEQQQTINNNNNENNNSNNVWTIMSNSNNIPPVIRAGIELGFYLFLGNLFQVIGLQTVPSDRAGFLVQLTTILVPLVQATLNKGSIITTTTWISCIIALLGIYILGFDNNNNVDISSSSSSSSSSSTVLSTLFTGMSLTSGDVLILCAAVVYSLHVVRLGRWASVTSPLQLVAYKATTELILGIILLIILAGIATTTTSDVMVLDSMQESGHEIVNFFTVVSERLAAGTLSTSSIQLALGATLWTGLVSTAYTTFAQSFGQSNRGISPTNANLIYSMQPIATAVFAYILLGETMGPFGILGGILIGGAVFVAASQSFSTTTTTTTTTTTLQDDQKER